MSPSAVPIGAYYLVLCGAMGLYMPYLALYLSSVGLSDAASVQVQAVVPFMSLFVPPLLGLLADARHARIWLLRGFSAASAVTFAALALAGDHIVAITLVLAAFALARSPLISLADATTHEHVRRYGGSYGRLRTWGSFGYLLAALFAGRIYDATSIRMVVWLTAVAFAILVVCAWRMPTAAPHREAGMLDEISRLLRTRSLWLCLAAISAGQLANTAYDSTVAIHLVRLGHGRDFVGVVVAIGVGAETILLLFSGALFMRMRAEHTLIAAFAVGAVRWVVLSMIDSKAALVLQAPLHAFSFGLYWVSATTLMREYAGPRAAAAGQGLLAAAVAVGSMIGNMYGGALFAQGGGPLLYGFAGAMAALATVLATAHAAARRRA